MSKAFRMLIIFKTMILIAACVTPPLQRVSYYSPQVCLCPEKSFPIDCQTLTEHFEIEFTIDKTDKENELVLNGNVYSQSGMSLRRSLSLYDRKNRFHLYLLEDELVVDKILLRILNDVQSRSYKLSGKFINKDFDALLIGYIVFADPGQPPP